MAGSSAIGLKHNNPINNPRLMACGGERLGRGGAEIRVAFLHWLFL
jgi:hypothetical protein